MSGRLTLIRFLHALVENANPNGSHSYTKNGASLLQMQCTLGVGDLAIETALLEQGADPNLADSDGDTPLHQININRAELKNRLATLPPIPEDAKLLEINSMDKLKGLIDQVAGKPQRVDELEKAYRIKATHEQTRKRLDRLEAYEGLLLSSGA